MRRSDPGFTLLEVMAAVAIVAIVFTMLARTANEGVHAEGISKRRLEASLLADRVLADFEQQVATGTAPEVGQTEFEEDGFAVLVDVTAFDLAGLIPASPETAAEGSRSSRSNPATEAASVVASAVRAVEIEVTWTEGANEANEYRVTRRSFGLDVASVGELLEASGLGLDPGSLAPGNIDPRNLDPRSLLR